jgi:exosome complex component RRP41
MEVDIDETAVIVGVLQTAINAVTLALVDAGIPMNDYICATSAGLVDNNAILGKF